MVEAYSYACTDEIVARARTTLGAISKQCGVALGVEPLPQFQPQR